MKIEEGKYYVTHCGEKVGPMRKWSRYVEHSWKQGNGSCEFNSIGDFWREDGSSKFCPALVAEWREQPFRIELGKRYVRRDGKISGVIQRLRSDDYDKLYGNYEFYDGVGAENRIVYTPDGRYLQTIDSAFDLIAEYPYTQSCVSEEVFEQVEDISEYNLKAVARLWTAHIHNRGYETLVVTENDVATMLRLMKEA